MHGYVKIMLDVAKYLFVVEIDKIDKKESFFWITSFFIAEIQRYDNTIY